MSCHIARELLELSLQDPVEPELKTSMRGVAERTRVEPAFRPATLGLRFEVSILNDLSVMTQMILE